MDGAYKEPFFLAANNTAIDVGEIIFNMYMIYLSDFPGFPMDNVTGYSTNHDVSSKSSNSYV